MKVVIIILSGLLSFVAAKYVRPKKVSEALAYGLSWVVIGVILDLLVTRQFKADIFTSKALWVGYLLILLAPLLRVKKV